MARTIGQQFNYAICSMIKTNNSKRQYRVNHGGRTDGYLFSNENIRKTRDMAKSLAKFLKRKHPEVKFAKDITTAMLQEWISENQGNWSDATVRERISQLKMLFLRISRVYDCEVACNPFELVAPPKRNIKYRCCMLSYEHLDMIRKSFKERDSKCASRIALELACRFGLRVKECAHLHVEDINLERRYIYVREGAKGGKRRYVPIRDKDFEYAKELKKSVEGQEYVLNGVTVDGINKGIRREMRSLGIDKYYPYTAIHSMRKYYAVERYNEEIANGKDEISAWETVQRELGHGNMFRLPLYDAYIQEPKETAEKRKCPKLVDLMGKIDMEE